jgi:hypothetical protein
LIQSPTDAFDTMKNALAIVVIGVGMSAAIGFGLYAGAVAAAVVLGL